MLQNKITLTLKKLSKIRWEINEIKINKIENDNKKILKIKEEDIKLQTIDSII